MGTTPHGFRRMPTLLLAAYRGDAAAVAALPLLFQRREIVIGLGMREEGEGEDRTRTRLGSRVVRAPVSDFAMQKTPFDNQNALHLAAGPGEERLAFVVAFLDLVGFETGMHTPSRSPHTLCIFAPLQTQLSSKSSVQKSAISSVSNNCENLPTVTSTKC